VLRAGRQQLIDCNPAARLQCQSNAFRRVAQMLAEIFADFDDTFFVHNQTIR
jgi:hypothetical protein